jgi:hypothetical protein
VHAGLTQFCLEIVLVCRTKPDGEKHESALQELRSTFARQLRMEFLDPKVLENANAG